jgi:hypothetical protein
VAASAVLAAAAGGSLSDIETTVAMTAKDPQATFEAAGKAAAGVSFEDRQDLLGHRSGRITTHYSAAELSRLIEAAESVVDRNGKRRELVVLRGNLGTDSRKTPAKPRSPQAIGSKSLI